MRFDPTGSISYSQEEGLPKATIERLPQTRYRKPPPKVQVKAARIGAKHDGPASVGAAAVTEGDVPSVGMTEAGEEGGSTNSVPVVTASAAAEAEESAADARDSTEDMCAICLIEYEHGDDLRIIPGCKHHFHKVGVSSGLFRRRRVVLLWMQDSLVSFRVASSYLHVGIVEYYMAPCIFLGCFFLSLPGMRLLSCSRRKNIRGPVHLSSVQSQRSLHFVYCFLFFLVAATREPQECIDPWLETKAVCAYCKATVEVRKSCCERVMRSASDRLGIRLVAPTTVRFSSSRRTYTNRDVSEGKRVF